MLIVALLCGFAPLLVFGAYLSLELWLHGKR
jgi:hypothetical protein